MAYGYLYTLPTITGSHSDFPVLLREDDFPSAAIDGTANAIDNGGGNLRAYTSSAKTTQLPVEVVTFVSSGSPEAEVYVKIPTAATSNTIFIEADAVETAQPAVTATYGRNAVWSDYEAVYHFDSASETTDSAGNHDLTENGTMAAITGKIGDGVDGDENTANFYRATGYTGILGSTSRTVTGWMKDGSADVGIVSWGADSSYNRWLMRTDSGAFRTEVRDFGLSTGSVSSSVYTKVTATLDGTTTADINIYINGSLSASGTGSNTINTTADGDVFIAAANRGDASTAEDPCEATDEIRIQEGAVSANWESTEYDNQNASSNWGTVGTWADAGGGTALIVQSLSQGQTLSNVTLTQSHVLAVDSLSQGQSISEPLLNQNNILAVDGVSQAQTIEEPDLDQNNVLATNDLSQGQTIGEPNLNQNHILATDNLSQAQTVSEPTLTQNHILAVDNLTQSQTIDNVTLVIQGALVVQGLSQAQSIDIPTLVQHHLLSVDNLSQGQSIGNVTLSVGGINLLVDGITQAQSIDNIDLTQLNILAVDNLTQQQLIDNVNLGGIVIASMNGELSIFSLYNGQISVTSVLTGDLQIF